MKAAAVDCLLHLSDTHFGTEQAPVVEALLRLAQSLAPRLVVLSGDITQRATADQFAAARRFMARLPPAPCLVLPGNHDLPLYNPWLRLRDPYGRYRAAFGAELNPMLSLGDDWWVLGANTTRAWRHRHGTLDAQQVATVAQRLRAAPPGAWRIVVTHHPMLTIDHHDDEDLPRGHAQALAAWCRAGADLLLGGHIHLPYVRAVDAALAAGPGGPGGPGSATQQTWVAQAGTAVSRRTRQGMANSVTVLTQAMQKGVRVREAIRWDYDAASGRFQAQAPLRLWAELPPQLPAGTGQPGHAPHPA